MLEENGGLIRWDRQKELMQMKRLMRLLFMLLALTGAALAEELPELDGAFLLDAMPQDTTYAVHAGPGEEYHVPAGGKAKVSTNDEIWCYGTTEDGWLLVDYQIGEGRSRIGYINIGERRWYPLLNFAGRQLTLTGHLSVTDDPDHSGQVIGTMYGTVTLLAYRDEWAYVEGTLSEWGDAPARGFVRRSQLSNAMELSMPIWQGGGMSYTLADTYRLTLPEDALAEGMQVHPLQDGTFLIAYRCAGSDRLWLRVVSGTGEKLWAKSIPSLYLSQITVTKTGFRCETFDNSEMDSGVRYTFTSKGRKWTSEKVGWIAEDDRYYAYSTENFTLRRGRFGEKMWMEIECIPTGEKQRHPLNYGSCWHLCEYEDFDDRKNLLLYDADENDVMIVFRFNDAGELTGSVAAPFAGDVDSAFGFRNAAYFYVGSGTDWVRWRLDCETMTFDSEPQVLTVPESCTFTPVSGLTSGLHVLLMQTDFGSYLCVVQPEGGTVFLMKELEGHAVQVFHGEKGLYVLLKMGYGNGFILQRYEASLG